MYWSNFPIWIKLYFVKVFRLCEFGWKSFNKNNFWVCQRKLWTTFVFPLNPPYPRPGMTDTCLPCPDQIISLIILITRILWTVGAHSIFPGQTKSKNYLSIISLYRYCRVNKLYCPPNLHLRIIWKSEIISL